MNKFKTVQKLMIVVLFVLLFPMILYLYLSPMKKEKVSYGLNFSNKYASELNQDWKNTFDYMVNNMPSNKYRLVVYWDEVQKDQNTYDYSNIKYQLNKLDQYPESEVILNIGRKVIRYPECHEPKWWQDLRDERAQKLALLKYVEKTTQELKNYKSIKYWQVENESMFPFGECTKVSGLVDLLKEEVATVRKVDPSRKILIQDSGEGGFWIPSSKIGDYLGISMYRKVWFDFFGMMSSYSFPLKYPIGSSFYKIKAFMLGIPLEKIKATEIQAEPWGPVRNYNLRDSEIAETMSQQDFENVFIFTKETGFDEFYLWGVEWWYHMKVKHNNSFYWDTAVQNLKVK